MPDRFDAIIPAGGYIKPAFADRVGTPAKALIDFKGRLILDRIIDALDESQLVRRTILIGSPEVLASEPAKRCDVVLEQGTSAPDNILKGLKWLSEQSDAPKRVFIVTTDLPLLTGEIIRRYVDMCPQDVNLTVPLISRAEWNVRFPNSDATFAKLADGEWTTGCAYLMDVDAFRQSLPYIEAVFQNRKSLPGMAKLLGFGFLLKLLTKRLTVPEVEAKIKTMLHCTGAAIRHAPPELSYDIDDETDLDYALNNPV